MAYNKTKTDPELGRRVHEHLVKVGVETPVTDNGFSRTDKIDLIEKNFTNIMNVMGLDLTDDSLMDTPKRVAKMYVNEIFWGLDYEAFPKCTAVDNKMKYDEMVIERNINVQSNCEHHFVVIDGVATVGYIPNERVLGLSKLNRVVEYFAKRPQIQERLTEQVYHALSYILDTDDIGVIVDAQHYCVKSRGVEDTGSSTITSKLGGCFKHDPAVRNEFMNIVNSYKEEVCMSISTRGPRNIMVLDRNCVPVNSICDQLCIGTETKVIQRRFAITVDEIYSCVDAWVDTRICTEQDFIKLSVFSHEGEFDVSTTGITDYVFLSLLALGRLTHPEVTNASMLHAFGLESIITDCCFDIVSGNTHYEMSELHDIVFQEFSRHYGAVDKSSAKELLRWLKVDNDTIEEFDE